MSEQYNNILRLRQELDTASIFAGDAWKLFILLEDGKAMAMVNQVIGCLQNVIKQVDLLLMIGAEDADIKALFDVFPVLLQAMEQKNGIDIADFTGYDIRVRLEHWRDLCDEYSRTLQ